MKSKIFNTSKDYLTRKQFIASIRKLEHDEHLVLICIGRDCDNCPHTYYKASCTSKRLFPKL